MTNKASRRDFLKAGTAGLCAWTLGVRGGTAEVSKRPNVLIVTTDQQCVTAMSAMGNVWVKTPNMDALAAHGVCFANSCCSYKYMVFPGTERNEMLFDLEADPGELKNLAGAADLSDELLRHRALLADWRTATAEEAEPIKSKKDGPRPKKKKKKA